MTFRILLSLFLFGFGTQSAHCAPPVIDLGYAQYQGTFSVSTNVTSYIGIRYAAAPVGDLRWRAPQDPEPIEGVQQATVQPNFCYSSSAGRAPSEPLSRLEKRAEASEDCLFLTVRVPGSVFPKDLPVVVFIHGGGYLGGSNAAAGEDLIRISTNKVVVVQIQYRLGMFGFLAGKRVKDGGSLNAGLLDQEFALRWVQRHISKFGGDPDKVTIWGSSAGAGSVLQHVIARSGLTIPRLFRGAIVSSPFLPPQYRYNDRIPEALYNEAVNRANCAGAEDTLTCLRNANVQVLQNANRAINAAGFYGSYRFVPVVDGSFITERATDVLSRGIVNGRALMAVANTNEGVGFVDQSTAGTVNTSRYISNMFPELPKERIDVASRLYARFGAPINQVNALYGEAIFVCPAVYLSDAFSGRAFKTKFAIPPGTHGQDAAYFFPTDRTPVYDNTAFRKGFSQSFLQFAVYLDPNEKFNQNIVPKWSRWNIFARKEMVFKKADQGEEPAIEELDAEEDLLERCRFWKSVGRWTGQ